VGLSMDSFCLHQTNSHTHSRPGTYPICNRRFGQINEFQSRDIRQDDIELLTSQGKQLKTRGSRTLCFECDKEYTRDHFESW